MIINYFGDGCFRVQNGETSLLLDSNNNRLKADVSVKTLTAPDIQGQPDPCEISFSGEYEIKGINIYGWSAAQESGDKFLKTVYLIKWEDMRLAFLGHLSEGLDENMLENVAEPDILILPMGGGHFLEPAAALKIAKQLEPAVVIPSFYKSAAEIAKAFGQKSDLQEKFVFKKKDLENENGKLVMLKNSA